MRQITFDFCWCCILVIVFDLIDINITYLSMPPSLIFNTVHNHTNPSHSQLLGLIALHPSFRAAVNQYYLLLHSAPSAQHLLKLGTLFFAFMLPDHPNDALKKLASQLLENIRTHDSEITYNNLLQYLLKLCSFALQSIDVRSAVGFLQLLRSRITDTLIVSIHNASLTRKLPSNIKLEILDVELILNESGLPQKHHRQEMKHIYFEQKFQIEPSALQTLKEDQVLVNQLKDSPDDVIPWGFVAQDYIFQYTNNNFQTKNTYRLRKCKRRSFDKLDYWCSPHEITNNAIRDFAVNQEIFLTSGVLTQNHLAVQIQPAPSKPLNIVRVNQAFTRKNYLQKLKETSTKEEKFFNILSQFFQRDQFDIDELTLTREKLVVRQKEQLLGISGKETIKKQIKDYSQEINNLGLKISKNLTKYSDTNLVQNNIKELTSSLKLILAEDSNINTVIEKHLSIQEQLRRDNAQPFLEDLIEHAKKVPLQLVVIGRPKSGKSTLARALAKEYSLVYISVESMIQKIFQRVKFYEQNPPETDEDGNPKQGLLPIQKYILGELQRGQPVEQQDVLELINNQLGKQFTHSRGFILDLPFQYNKYWIQTLVSNRIYLPKIGCRFFTHIVHVSQTEQQWKYFTSGLMEKPQDQKVSSALDRYLLRKPKPPPQEGEEEQAQANQEEKPQPLLQTNLLQVRCQDSSYSLIEHLSQHIHPHRFITIHNSHQSVTECLGVLAHSLYKIPLPKKIEGAQKQLLGVGLDQLKIFRKWSAFGLIDCVELQRGKLLSGKYQFAAEYAGRVLVFQNQNNLNSFLNLPRKYLTRPPALPKGTNLCIVGPRKSGKKTIAKLLAQIYQLQVVNIQEIIQSIILTQREFESHVPSNFDKRVNSIHLSEGEYKDFYKGGLLNAKDILPMILYKLGVVLQKKPPGWGVEKAEDGQAPPQTQQRKPAPKKTKVKKDKNAQDERPKTPPPEDLALKEIIPEINFMGKLNEIKGYIIIGYPNNQEQLNALKQFNIPIDKLLILSDNTQENPNKTLQTRLTDAQLEQVALFNAAIAPVKQGLGQQVCKEIFIDKTPQEMVNKIRQLIDPFYLKTDDDAINRVCADKTQQSDPIPMGFSGDFCPVSLQSGWLIKGKEEFQAGIQGRRFKFCGEKQLLDFKSNPSKYLAVTSPALPPRILFMGIRGVGLRSQLLKLNQKYKIPILALKDTLLQQLQNQKNKRKTQRYYNKGFKKPQFDEQGKQIEDPQLLEEAADFDRKVNQVEVLKNIFKGIDDIFINGNFFEVEEDKVSTNIVELLGEARRLPQVVVMLTSDQPKWLQRVLDRKAIQKQLQDMKQKRRLQKQKQRQQARQKALEAGEQYNQPAEQQDTELPKLQQLIAQKQQTLKAQRQADMSKIQQYSQAFKGLGVQVINIKCERQIKHVTDRINTTIKTVIEDRVGRWQKNNMMIIDRFRVQHFLNNYIASDSRFGKLNPFSLMEVPKPYPLIYRDRIYYLRDQEQRQMVLRNPKTLHQNDPIPHDVKMVPSIFILGKTKTGKSNLAANLSQKYGFKVIDLQSIIQQFVKQHEDADIRLILNDIRAGKCLSDQATVTLIEKRVSLADCARGWVLDGLPANKKQCQLLNKRGILPTSVLTLRMTDLQLKKRVAAKAQQSKNSYDWNLQIVHRRLQSTRHHLTEVEVYYMNKYNNVKTIDAGLSKWGILEQSRIQVQLKIKAKRQFIRDLVTHSASNVTHIGLSSNCILHNLSQFSNFCPISYKIRREYVRLCLRNYQHLALFHRKLYIFKSLKELQDFVANPQTFVNRGAAFSPPVQLALEDIAKNQVKYENQGYCIVELLKKNFHRGNYLFGLQYKNRVFLTSTAQGLKLFQKNPALYQMLKLPDKLPVQFQKKSDLKKIAKRNDCSAFLQHHLSTIMMRCLAQLGYRRPKYPTLGSKESALKFLSISLKANNPNKDEAYRNKYKEKLNRFIKECTYTQEIREWLERKQKGEWNAAEEEHLVKLCEEYHQFLGRLQAGQKATYFSEFIR